MVYTGSAIVGIGVVGSVWSGKLGWMYCMVDDVWCWGIVFFWTVEYESVDRMSDLGGMRSY